VRNLLLALSLAPALVAADKAPAAPKPLREPTPFERMAAAASIRVETTAWKDADDLLATGWRTELLLAKPFSTRIAAVGRSKAPGSTEVPTRMDLTLEDRDGTTRTIFSFTRLAPRGQSFPAWISFGRQLDLTGRFEGKGAPAPGGFRLEHANQTLVGLGPEIVPPYLGFASGYACLGYFQALGLVERVPILVSRRVSRKAGNMVADTWTAGWTGFDTPPEEFKAAKAARAKLPGLQGSQRLPETGDQPLVEFIRAHHILGPSVSTLGLAGVEGTPKEPQDAVLPLAFTEPLSVLDQVYAGDHENGRKFVLTSLMVPGFPCWILAAQYQDETYPRLAIFVHDLVGLTRNGKTVVWMQIPQVVVGKDTGRPAVSPDPNIVYALEHQKVDWKRVVMTTALAPARTDLDHLPSGTKVNTASFGLKSAINGLRQ